MEDIICNTKKIECTFSESEEEKSVVIGRHSHLVCEFIIIIEGKVSVIVENRRYKRLGAGHLIMIPPLTYHSITSETAEKYRRISLRFHSDEIPEKIRDQLLEKIKETPVTDLSTAPHITENLVRVLTRHNSEKYHPLVESILIETFYFALGDKRSGEVDGTTDERLLSVIRYIDENLTEPITLKEISEHTFLSVSSICHLFQSRMKTTVKQYILQKKIYYAYGLIRKGVPATKAAAAIGYKNYADFYQIYKKIADESPGETKSGTLLAGKK